MVHNNSVAVVIPSEGVISMADGLGVSLQANSGSIPKNNKRVFRPNVQKIRVKLPSGQVKRMWVSAKAIKAGKIDKG